MIKYFRKLLCRIFGHVYELPIYKPRRARVLSKPDIFCKRCGKKYPTSRDYLKQNKTKKKKGVLAC